MRFQRFVMLAIVLIPLLCAGNLPQRASMVYVEPRLVSAHSPELSVIVTAGDSAAAAQAVRRAGGKVCSELWLIDAVAATVPARRLGALASDPRVLSVVDNKGVQAANDPTNWDGWVTDYRFPVPWDGSPDVVPTQNKGYYHLTTLIPVDIGADKVHRSFGVLGSNVTVAIVDSGIYVSEQTKSELGMQTLQGFQGQADFVDPVCGTYKVKNRTVAGGAQYDGYCFTDIDHSVDAYGHGSHVAAPSGVISAIGIPVSIWA
jgi:hypothetical protein